MSKIDVVNTEGKKVKELTLNDKVFGIKPNENVVHSSIVNYLANQRQGTQSTKTRAEVRGGGKKPWRQKGTGRARQGSIRAAQWRGGGVIFAPTPRDHSIKVNRKVVRLAMKSLLSEKVKEQQIYVLEELVLESFKTKGLVEVLTKLNVADKKVILVLEESDDNVRTAGRNLPNVNIQTVSHASVYQLANADVLVLTKAAAQKYEEVLQ